MVLPDTTHLDDIVRSLKRGAFAGPTNKAHAYELPLPGRWPGRTISAGVKTPPERTSRIVAKVPSNVALVGIYPRAPQAKLFVALMGQSTSDITIIDKSLPKRLSCETISSQLDRPERAVVSTTINAAHCVYGEHPQLSMLLKICAEHDNSSLNTRARDSVSTKSRQ